MFNLIYRRSSCISYLIDVGMSYQYNLVFSFLISEVYKGNPGQNSYDL